MDVPAAVEELIASLKRQIAALQAKVAVLRRQLGQDSSNSSKPPSSDGLKKKPRIAGSLRGRSGKASGGQKGHPGGTLRQVADPDHVVRREACACCRCGSPLEPQSAIGVEKRQVFDLPERPLVVTEHQASIYRSAHCRGETKAAFPEGVVSPTQYGERIRAAAIYLNIQQLIPEDRTAQALSDLFGAPLICPASIVACVRKKAEDLQQVYARIGERVAEVKVRHLDETGFRIAGKLQWLHTTSSLAFTFYRAGDKRGENLTRRYEELCAHYGMTPSRNNRGLAHENGAIESPHGHLKKWLEDELLLRGSRDFENLAAYRRFIDEVVGRRNARNRKRIEIERTMLRPLPEL